jgi:flagellar assembly factor FliW
MKMIIKTARFGEVELNENDILNFSPGLLAFESLTRYILLDIVESPFFKWLQSIDNPELAFLLIDPFVIKKDYNVDINDELADKLGISMAKDVLVYTIVTVPHSGLKDATTNLMGPLVINWPKKQGKQIILDGMNYNIKFPLKELKTKVS